MPHYFRSTSVRRGPIDRMPDRWPVMEELAANAEALLALPGHNSSLGNGKARVHEGSIASLVGDQKARKPEGHKANGPNPIEPTASDPGRVFMTTATDEQAFLKDLDKKLWTSTDKLNALHPRSCRGKWRRAVRAVARVGHFLLDQ